MEVRMEVLPDTARRRLTKCPRILVRTIGLVISAVFVASPEDADKCNHTFDSMASTARQARQSSGSNTLLPERSVEEERDPSGHSDRKAGVSHEVAGCSEGIVFQSANNVVYSGLPLEVSPIGTKIETLRNPESEQSDGRVTKFAPTFPLDSSTSLTRRTQTTAAPSCLQRVTIKSNPCGATIYLDGIQTGRTPMSFPVPPGRYTLILLAPGHQMYGHRILVPDGPLEINANLVPER
jgi:PEGA domain